MKPNADARGASYDENNASLFIKNQTARLNFPLCKILAFIPFKSLLDVTGDHHFDLRIQCCEIWLRSIGKNPSYIFLE